MTNQGKLDHLKLNIIGNSCTRCSLSDDRDGYIVFGDGPAEAKIMILGEGPGFEEQRTGHPFTGPAGQLLNRILAKINVPRETIYICNAVKCRPLNNRNPTQVELDTCKPFLESQIEIIQPKVIIGLGKVGFSSLFPDYSKVPMKAIRGKTFSYRGINVVPTYHPAYILRITGTEQERDTKLQVLSDFNTALSYV